MLSLLIDVEDLSDRQIAKMVGCGPTVIFKKRKLFDIKKKVDRDRNNISGREIEGVVVLRRVGSKDGGSSYLVKCKLCDKEWIAIYGNIKKGLKSCGCDRYKKGKDNARWKGYENLPGSCLSLIRSRAESIGLEFNLTPKYLWELFLQQDGKCRFTNIELVLSPARTQTASVDRIDSSKGYIEGNVQLVHKWVNVSKWDMSDEEFIVMCNMIAKNHPRDDVWEG